MNFIFIDFKCTYFNLWFFVSRYYLFQGINNYWCSHSLIVIIDWRSSFCFSERILFPRVPIQRASVPDKVFGPNFSEPAETQNFFPLIFSILMEPPWISCEPHSSIGVHKSARGTTRTPAPRNSESPQHPVSPILQGLSCFWTILTPLHHHGR